MHMLWKVSLLSKARQILRVGGKVSEWNKPQPLLDLYFLNCFALVFEQIIEVRIYNLFCLEAMDIREA